MLSPCQLFALSLLGGTSALLAIATYQSRPHPRQSEVLMEPSLPSLGDCPIDDSPMPAFDQGDRAEVQALLLVKAIARWLEEEATHYPVEVQEAIEDLAVALRTQGVAVLNQE